MRWCKNFCEEKEHLPAFSRHLVCHRLQSVEQDSDLTRVSRLQPGLDEGASRHWASGAAHVRRPEAPLKRADEVVEAPGIHQLKLVAHRMPAEGRQRQIGPLSVLCREEYDLLQTVHGEHDDVSSGCHLSQAPF